MEEEQPEQQSTEQQSTEQQSTEQQSTEQQSAEQQLTEQQLTEQQLTEQPLTEHPLTEQPLTEQPLTEQQLTEQQLTEQPTPIDEFASPCTLCYKVSETSLEKEENALTDGRECLKPCKSPEMMKFPEDICWKCTKYREIRLEKYVWYLYRV